jgi:very-short-patch-repair endonuclease
MTSMFRLQDQAALDALLKRSHCRMVRLVPRAPEEIGGRKAKPKAAKVKLPKPRSEIEALMSQQIRASGLPAPVEWPDYFKPIPDRKFTADFYFRESNMIVEIDGMAHRVKQRFVDGFERRALLTLAGYRTLHVCGQNVRDGSALIWLTALMGKK